MVGKRICDLETQWTRDVFFGGQLIVYQWRKGYRFSLDAVVLANLSRVNPQDRVIDLGTGCGIVPLILACRGLGKHLVGLEIQTRLVEVARKNVEANNYRGRIEIIEMDFREVKNHFPRGSFDLVVSNPPYRELGSGRLCPASERAIARHELRGNIQDVFEAARYLLSEKGRVAVVYPASRLDHLMRVALELKLYPKRLTIVYTQPTRPAWLAHLECRKGGGKGLIIEPPLTLYKENGSYSEAANCLFRL